MIGIAQLGGDGGEVGTGIIPKPLRRLLEPATTDHRGGAGPEYRLVPAPDGEDDCYSMGIYVSDVDAVVERAVAAGAHVREAPSDFVSGDRFASIRDPFGVRWSVMTRIEDISEEESARHVAEWAASFSEAPAE